jgi:hypothetical protein
LPGYSGLPKEVLPTASGLGRAFVLKASDEFLPHSHSHSRQAKSLEQKMLRRKRLLMKFLCCIAFLAVAMGSPANAEGRAINSDQIEQSGIKLPGTDFAVLLEMGKGRPSAPLLTAIETWLSTQFDLPAIQSHPRIELVPVKKIVALRYRGLLPNGGMEAPLNSRSAISSENDTVAVYSDSAQTIYLAQGWTGRTAAELSTLVHEMVHHIQHLAGLKHECPQAREKLAYMAQDRWLNVFGGSLAQDFDLDGLSLLVKTKCFF